MDGSPDNAPAPAPDPVADGADTAPLPADRLPAHIAVIMDGNGRWACQRGLPRAFGHRAGATSVRTCVRTCRELGIGALTLYSFSNENWKRPADEVRALMDLLLQYLAQEEAEMIERGIRFRQIGRRDRLAPEVLEAIERTETATAAGRDLQLFVAIDYGSRDEITRAVRSVAADVAAGRLDPDAISPDDIAARLDTAAVPDPDLLIRTAGERRLSNYLLWQLSYAELHVSPVLWPDFDADRLHEALHDFAGRRRRFGGLDDDSDEAAACATSPPGVATTDDAAPRAATGSTGPGPGPRPERVSEPVSEPNPASNPEPRAISPSATTPASS